MAKKTSRQLDREISEALSRKVRRGAPGSAYASPECRKCAEQLVAEQAIARAASRKKVSSKKTTRSKEPAKKTGKKPPKKVAKTQRKVVKRPRGAPEHVPASVQAPGGSLDPLPIVLEAVQEMPSSGRFGKGKVFISALWDAVGGQIGGNEYIDQETAEALDLAWASAESGGGLTSVESDIHGAPEPASLDCNCAQHGDIECPTHPDCECGCQAHAHWKGTHAACIAGSVGCGCKMYRPRTTSSVQTFDPAERAREKQASRDADARALATGEKTAEQLRIENASFAFPRARIRFPKSER